MLLTDFKIFFLIPLLMVSVFNVKTVCADIRIPVYVYPDRREHAGNLDFLKFASHSYLLEFKYANAPTYKSEIGGEHIFFVQSKNRYLRAFSACLAYCCSEPQIALLGTLILKKISHNTKDIQQMNTIIEGLYYFKDLRSGKDKVLSEEYNLAEMVSDYLQGVVCEVVLDLGELKKTKDLLPANDSNYSETCFFEETHLLEAGLLEARF